MSYSLMMNNLLVKIGKVIDLSDFFMLNVGILIS